MYLELDGVDQRCVCVMLHAPAGDRRGVDDAVLRQAYGLGAGGGRSRARADGIESAGDAPAAEAEAVAVPIDDRDGAFEAVGSVVPHDGFEL
jgi:hypothetical protein